MIILIIFEKRSTFLCFLYVFCAFFARFTYVPTCMLCYGEIQKYFKVFFSFFLHQLHSNPHLFWCLRPPMHGEAFALSTSFFFLFFVFCFFRVAYECVVSVTTIFVFIIRRRVTKQREAYYVHLFFLALSSGWLASYSGSVGGALITLPFSSPPISFALHALKYIFHLFSKQRCVQERYIRLAKFFPFSFCA